MSGREPTCARGQGNAEFHAPPWGRPPGRTKRTVDSVRAGSTWLDGATGRGGILSSLLTGGRGAAGGCSDERGASAMTFGTEPCFGGRQRRGRPAGAVFVDGGEVTIRERECGYIGVSHRNKSPAWKGWEALGCVLVQ